MTTASGQSDGHRPAGVHPSDADGAGTGTARAGTQGTDAIDLLRDDHREIEHLFFSLIPNGALGSRDVFERLSEKLSTHSAIEKEVFYPAVRASLAGGDDLVKEAVLEHKAVELSLERLHRVKMDSNDFTLELRALSEEVRAHVRKEEEDVFAGMRNALDPRTLSELGSKMLRALHHAPTRPHPHAPAWGAGAKLADFFVSPLDKMRDLLRRKV
jgi:hemerythrin superfamily protein